MVASAIEKVQVILEAITTRFNSAMDAVNTKLQSVNKNMQGFGQVMAEPMDRFKKLNGNFKSMQTTGGKLAYKIRFLTHGLRGFRMEMLGVMFFGLMLQQTFLGFLQPVMEAYGVFDLFNVMLLTVFLPIMDLLFPVLLKVMEYFMNLPESTKLLIGVMVVLGAIFGTILFTIGSFALGIGSLIQGFALLGPAFAGTGALAGLAAIPLGAIIAIIVALIAVVFGAWLAWKENFMNMQAWVALIWEGIKNIFGGAFDIIMGIVDIFTGLFEGDLDKVLAGCQRVFGGVIRLLTGFIQFVWGIFVASQIAVARLLSGIATCVGEAAVRLAQWLNDALGGLPLKLFNWGVQMIKGLADGVKSMAKYIMTAILSIFPEWARNMIWNSGKLTINILENVGKGISGAVNSLLGKKGDFISRPGQPTVAFSPEDTIIGTKGGLPSGGTTSITNHFYGFTRDDLRRELDDRDRRMVDELRRMVKT